MFSRYISGEHDHIGNDSDIIGFRERQSVSFISYFHTPFPVQLTHTSLQARMSLPYMTRKGSVILSGSIWRHISCCTEEKLPPPCIAVMKEMLLGIDFDCPKWQISMTYSPPKLPISPNILNLEYQLHSYGYPWSSSPLSPCTCQFIVPSWTGGVQDTGVQLQGFSAVWI